MKLIRQCGAFLLCAALFLSFFDEKIYAEEQPDDISTSIGEILPEVGSKIALPDNMRATILTPAKDFYTDPEMTAEGIIAELDDIYGKMTDFGLNTALINTVADGTAYYDTDMNRSDSADALTLAIDTASAYGISVYPIIDINYIVSETDFSEKNNHLVSEVHKFVIKYLCGGVILNNYYAEKTDASYAEYMENGSGIGYTNWLYETTECRIKTAADIIRSTDNSVAVGMMINDVWANYNSNELGSETADSVEAYYDGYSDTRAFVENGYADFVTARSYGAINDPKLPFGAFSEWWGKLCQGNNIPLYIIHYNEKLGTDYAGWGAEDQLLRQLTLAKDIPAYSGSVFNSYASLCANPLNTTTTLTAYYSNQINEESLFEDLSMTLPKELSFTTYEPVQEFAGTFDENYTVTLNGSPITLNEAGKFYFEKPLSIGNNTFKITHKGKTYVYKIERKIITMKSIDDSIGEGKTLNVDGETTITISAIAYKGASVVASINGENLTLKQSSATLDDDDLNTNYARFTKKYTVPAGVIGKEQSLGQIVVSASFEGYSRTLYGASVVVNAEPEPVVNVLDATLFEADSVGTGEIVGTVDPTHTADEAVKLVKLYENYTDVYDAKTTGAELKPTFGQLPAGTLDYYKGSSGNYYITESGKRISGNDATVIDGTGIGDNPLTVKSVGTYGDDSYIKIALGTRISYNVEVAGNSYYTAFDGDYNLDSFNAEYVYVTFDNITSVTKLPSFEYNLVFSAGKWETVEIDGIPKFRLVLTLRQKGVYSGCGAYYNGDGDLMLTFGVMTNALSNLTVVIDPGHGYGKSATVFDPGAVGHVVEEEVVLSLAKELSAQLTNLGVGNVRLQTESTYLLTTLRPYYARSYGCDLYISLHANKVQGNDSARGVEVYYFTPYSQPLAASISENIANYFASNVYADGIKTNRGAKYSYFWVTVQQDFPSVLVETGFVSNLEEAMALADTEKQKGIAAAIIEGLKAYVGRSSISFTEEGGVDIPADLVPEPTDSAVTAPPNAAADPNETTAESTTDTLPEETTAADTEATAAPTTDEYGNPITDTAPEETVPPSSESPIDTTELPEETTTELPEETTTEITEGEEVEIDEEEAVPLESDDEPPEESELLIDDESSGEDTGLIE